jgi:hypothetical protein
MISVIQQQQQQLLLHLCFLAQEVGSGGHFAGAGCPVFHTDK